MGAANKLSGSCLNGPVLQPPSGNQVCVKGSGLNILCPHVSVEDRPLRELSHTF